MVFNAIQWREDITGKISKPKNIFLFIVCIQLLKLNAAAKLMLEFFVMAKSR